MDQNSRLVDAAFPMQFGNQKYDASQLTDRDFEDLKLYIKAVYLNNARQLTFEMDDDARKEFQTAALNEAMNIEWGSDIAGNIIFTRDGTMHLAFQMIRKRHPNVTFISFARHFDGTLAIKQKLITEDDKSKFISESINTTMLAWNALHYNDEDVADKDEDQGGSLSESSKSGENQTV